MGGAGSYPFRTVGVEMTNSPSSPDSVEALRAQCLKAVCSAGERCSCADRNWQWRDQDCAVAMGHVDKIVAALHPPDVAATPIAWKYKRPICKGEWMEEYSDTRPDEPVRELTPLYAGAAQAVAATPREPVAYRWRYDDETETRWDLRIKRPRFADNPDVICEPLFTDVAQPSWQPIETAPKNGTEIWLYREDCGAFLGRWIAPCEFLNEAEYEGDQGWDECDWFFADFVRGGRVTDGAPTHWIPLPTPPLSSTDGAPSDRQFSADLADDAAMSSPQREGGK